MIAKYIEKLTNFEISIANRVLRSRKKTIIQLAKKDSPVDLVLTLINIFYLPNNSSNLISLSLFNNAGIYYHNKDQILYNQNTWKILAFTKKYKTSFLLCLFNLSSVVINLLKKYKVYKRPKINYTQSERLYFTLWQ